MGRLSGEPPARFRTEKAQLLGVPGGPARRAAYPRVVVGPSVKVVCFCLQEAHQPNGRTYLTMKQPVTRQTPADRRRAGGPAGHSERQHSRQMMATLPCDSKGDRAPRITLDPTRCAQQTVFRTGTNMCYSGRFRAPGRTGSGTECRRWGATGRGQPAAGQEELPPHPAPPVKCAPSLLVRDALGTQENTQLRAAARAWHTPVSADAARNTGSKGEFPSEREQLEPQLTPRT